MASPVVALAPRELIPPHRSSLGLRRILEGFWFFAGSGHAGQGNIGVDGYAPLTAYFQSFAVHALA